jgi:hypothetical protein
MQAAHFSIWSWAIAEATSPENRPKAVVYARLRQGGC